MIDNKEYVNPAEEDFLLTDIDEHKLFVLAEILGVKHLEPLSQTFPTSGFIFGTNNRAIIPLSCRYAQRPEFCVIFIVDTGAPTTHLSNTTVKTLTGTKSGPANVVNISIQGFKPLRCYVSQKHFEDVNVLGVDFLKANGLKLSIDYSTDSLILQE
jgi:hypothetical protein